MSQSAFDPFGMALSMPLALVARNAVPLVTSPAPTVTIVGPGSGATVPGSA
ncbi:MAG TPA: hypothetical protein VIQ60_07695 [Gemmatimonadaceae bacterium]